MQASPPSHLKRRLSVSCTCCQIASPLTAEEPVQKRLRMADLNFGLNLPFRASPETLKSLQHANLLDSYSRDVKPCFAVNVKAQQQQDDGLNSATTTVDGNPFFKPGLVHRNSRSCEIELVWYNKSMATACNLDCSMFETTEVNGVWPPDLQFPTDQPMGLADLGARTKSTWDSSQRPSATMELNLNDAELEEWIVSCTLSIVDETSPPSLSFFSTRSSILWTYMFLQESSIDKTSRKSGLVLYTGIPVESSSLCSIDQLPTLPKKVKREANVQQADSMLPNLENLDKASAGTTTETIGSTVDKMFGKLSIPLPGGLMPEWIVNATKWDETLLGPVSTWPRLLQSMASVISTLRDPLALFWGPKLILVSNQTFAELTGKAFSSIIGKPLRDAGPELRDPFADAFEKVYETGVPIAKQKDRLFLSRGGFLEETYWDWSAQPLTGKDGDIVGLLDHSRELTEEVIAERRMHMLREIGERTALARNESEYWSKFMDALEVNQLDTPFAIAYSRVGAYQMSPTVSPTTSIDAPSIGSFDFQLMGTCGVPSNHACAPNNISTRDNTSSIALGNAFLEALGKEYVHLEISDANGLLPQTLFDGLEYRGFGDPCKSLIVCPIRASNDTEVSSAAGFVVLGVNPRRPFDKSYQLFTQLLTRQLTTSLSTVLLSQRDKMEAEQAAQIAAADKTILVEKLAQQKKRTQTYEQQLARLTEISPFALLVMDPEGNMVYVNDMWYEITQHPRSAPLSEWYNFIYPDDIPLTEAFFQQLLSGVGGSIAIRAKGGTAMAHGVKVEKWILCKAFVQHDENDVFTSIVGCLTDISVQKHAENVQIKRLEEAKELKRQQDNFVDIASHELRNPLSAILQCADELVITLTELLGKHIQISQELSRSIEAAQTILVCAEHQKSIIEDILTVSKLDSARLTITPVRSQPIQVVQNTIRMFQKEADRSKTSMSLKVTDGFKELAIDSMMLDPTRLSQVLINLITNGLKFTGSDGKAKLLAIIIGAERNRPLKLPNWNSTTCTDNRNESASMDCTDNDEVFLTVQVINSGKGISDDEAKYLFQKFQQATPKTHIHYGGSGLGLFICREIVQLQDGEISVTSDPETGTIFSFYIKCSRATTLPQTNGLTAESGTNAAIHSGTHELAGASTSTKISKVHPKRDLTLSPSSKTTRSYKVLLVEDNLINQRVVQRQLERIGCQVYVANHGAEAIDMLCASTLHVSNLSLTSTSEESHELSVILMDIEMPVMDGLTATQEIRKLEKAGLMKRHVPIIAITANARPKQVMDMEEAGVDLILHKPFTLLELTDKLDSLLS